MNYHQVSVDVVKKMMMVVVRNNLTNLNLKVWMVYSLTGANLILKMML